MTPNEKYGRTEVAPTRILDPVEFDFAAGKPLPPGLGKTHIPVRPVPALSGEMRPVLQVTFWVRPSIPPTEVATDLLRAWQALDEFDRSRDGAGLAAGRIRTERQADNDVIQIVVSAIGPEPRERLIRLREALSAGPWPGRTPIGASFVRWAADSSAAA